MTWGRRPTVPDFVEARRAMSRLRLGLEGPAGAGKTYTALKIATVLAAHDAGKIGLIDSERGRSATYSEGRPYHFSILMLDDKSPSGYVEALVKAQRAGFPVVIVDSGSHEWKGTLALVDREGEKRKGNTWSGWSVGRPAHDAFVDAVLAMPAHTIVTYRSRQATEQVKRDGKTVVNKLGLAPVAPDDIDFEFDVWGSIDHETQTVVITKSTIDTIPMHAEYPRGEGIAEAYLEWLGGAEYANPRPSDDMLRALLKRAIEASEGLKRGDLQAVVGGGGAIAWLRDHEDNVEALIAEVVRVRDARAGS